MNDFKHLYLAKLQQIQDDMQTFANSYPLVARRLQTDQDSQRDPYVERLLEGVAYLTARIEYQRQHWLPQTFSALTQRLWPDLPVAFPSQLVVEIDYQGPDKAQLLLQRGTLGTVNLASELPTYFTLSRSALWQALTISEAQMTRKPSGQVEWKIRLQKSEQHDWQSFNLHKLTFFINLKPAQGLELLYDLCFSLERVNCEQDGCQLKGDICVTTELLTGSVGVWQSIYNYYYATQQQGFFHVRGLQAETFDGDSHAITLKLVFKRTATWITCLPDNWLLLNCAVIENAFKDDMEPILANDKKTQYSVMGSKGYPLYKVDEVTLQHCLTQVRSTVPAIHDFVSDPEQGRYYLLDKPEANHHRQLVILGRTLTDQVISATGIASQGSLAEQITVNQPLQIVGQPNLRLRARVKPSRYVAIQGQQMLSTALLNIARNTNFADELRAVLFANNQLLQVEQHEQILAIQSIHQHVSSRVQQGAVKLVQHWQLKVDDNSFLHRGDLLLFSNILLALIQAWQPCFFEQRISFVSPTDVILLERILG